MKRPTIKKIIKFSDLTLKWKLQLIIVATSLLMLLISFVVISLNTIEDFKSDLLHEADLIAGMTADYCGQEILNNSFKNVNQIIETLGSLPEVKAAALYNNNEKLVTVFLTDSVSEMPREVPPLATSYFDDNVLHTFKPIMNKNKVAGTIYVIMATKSLNKRIRAHLFTMILFFSILLIFAILISAKLQKYISEPILRLSRTTREIASLEDYSVKVKKAGQDEVGELYDSFNEMLDQIYTRDLERNKAMRALRDSEERYRKVIELSPNGILLHENEIIVYANPKAIEMAAVNTLDEIIGLHIYEFIHPDFRAKQTRLTAKALINGSELPVVEEKFSRRNGESLDTMIAAVPFGSEGSSTVLTVIQDITDFNKAQQALVQSEARFRQIVEKSNDGMYVLYDRKFVMVNPRMVEMLGYSQEEMLADDFDPLVIVPHDNRDFIVERQKAFHRGEYVQTHYQTKIVKKDGSLFEVESNLSRISWDGKPAVMGMLRDITEQKHLEEQLRQSQKMEAIGTLAGGVAHDFNNLLTVISGHIELAQLKLKENDALSRHIEEINKAGKRAQNLTRQLLAFSRKQIIKRKALHINTIIEDMEKMLNRLIGEDLNMRMILNSNLPKIVADPGQLEQILMNLVINARDAIRENQDANAPKDICIETDFAELNEKNDLTLELKEEQKFIVLAISDSGIGMNDDIKAKMFEPFFTTKGVGKGTGLGLSTIYGIVKQNEGNIHVYSEPGKGTVVKIYWPIPTEEPLESAVEDNALNDSKPKPGKETVLFVEDDQGVREFAVTALKDLGYTIYEADNAHTALKMVNQDKIKFDLLVTDLVMPGMSGKELADKLDEEISDLKVLFASGYTEGNIVTQGILNEGINFIHKPYSVRALSDKIRNVLNNQN